MSKSALAIRKDAIKAVKKIIEGKLSKTIDDKAINALKEVLREIDKSLPY